MAEFECMRQGLGKVLIFSAGLFV